MRPGAADRSEPRYTHSLLARCGWSGRVTPREVDCGKIQKDKPEGRRTCGHWLLLQRWKWTEVPESDWFSERLDRFYDMGEQATSNNQPREWAIRGTMQQVVKAV
jgi:hypothetical protein